MSQPAANIRSFIAIAMPPAIIALISTVQEELGQVLGDSARAIRWVRPENVHLTLQFLGDVPADRIDAVGNAVAKVCAGIPRFSLEVSGLGVFPNQRRPRVLWVGLEGNQQARSSLRALHVGIGEEMRQFGFRPEENFKPHLTLGRVREGAARNELQDISNALSDPESQPVFATTVEVGAVTLMRSDLQRGGSIYTPLARIPLG